MEDGAGTSRVYSGQPLLCPVTKAGVGLEVWLGGEQRGASHAGTLVRPPLLCPARVMAPSEVPVAHPRERDATQGREECAVLGKLGREKRKSGLSYQWVVLSGGPHSPNPKLFSVRLTQGLLVFPQYFAALLAFTEEPDNESIIERLDQEFVV